MSNETIILLVLLVLVLGVLPAWPHSNEWGYRPTGVLTIFLIIFLIWAVADHRPLFRSSVGSDIKQTGRDAADSIRRAVQ